MIWLTWRQLRLQTALVYALLGAVVVTLALTGGDLSRLHRASGEQFLEQLQGDRGLTAVYIIGVVAVIVLPLIIGIFWGAPLVTRELEAGTHRLVWNQSVTRNRWLATKLGVAGLAAVAGAGLLSLAVTWWCGPIDKVVGGNDPVSGPGGGGLATLPRLSEVIFDARGIVPVGYAAFAFVLGVTAGVLLRRLLPAMALTLAVFVAVQIMVPLWIRPHLMPPVRYTTTITMGNFDGLMMSGPNGPVKNITVKVDSPGAWLLANRTVDAAGHPVGSYPAWLAACLPQPGVQPAPPTAPGQEVPAQVPAAPAPAEALKPGGMDRTALAPCLARLTALGYRQQVVYQPASRYWALQWIETAMYLALAGLLAGLCFWRTRRLS
jgi:hypothetical protein